MKVAFLSLGCDKNSVDSQRMLGLLHGRGYALTKELEEAEVIVINTCCFIDEAKQESIEAILDAALYKTKGVLQILLVAGCMAQRYRQEILQEITEVDAIVGTTAYDRILDAIDQAKEGLQPIFISDSSRTLTLPKRWLEKPTHSSYLKIAEGCDHHCTYCVIPQLRGKYRSARQEDLLEEAKELAGQGVKELLIVAQDITCYGEDIYGENRLPQLLRSLCRIEGLRWIRLLYCYPEGIRPELIRTIQEEPKICHYLDMPIQHAHNAILKRMGRKITREQLQSLVQKLRTAIPDISLRTTLITGFPGETKAHHESLLQFLQEMSFSHVGVFLYSREEGTAAANMPEQIPTEVKQQRFAELMAVQQRIVCRHQERQVGKCFRAIIDGVEEEGRYRGRTYADAPEVDSEILIKSEKPLRQGDMVQVQVQESDGYDLKGVAIDEPAK